MRIGRYGLVLLTLAAGAQQRQALNFYRVDKEAAIGKQLAAQMASKTTPAGDPAADAYVSHLVAQLAAHIPDDKFAYTVAIVKEDLGAEPTVLPGGYIFLSAGIFRACESESEFAGLLAHAMAHVARRDGTMQATRGDLSQIATIPLEYMDGWQGYAIREGMGQALPQGYESFVRMSHLAADSLAVKAMAESGYDPAALARYLERTGQADRFRADRVKALREATAHLTFTPAGDGAEFAKVKDSLGK